MPPPLLRRPQPLLQTGVADLPRRKRRDVSGEQEARGNEFLAVGELGVAKKLLAAPGSTWTEVWESRFGGDR